MTTSAPEGPVVPGLRDVALKSGAYLAGREALGLGIRLAGLVLVVRHIGTGGFGIYSGAAAFCLFGTVLAQMGAEVYLIRLPGPIDRRRYDEVFTFLLCTSLAVVAVGEGLSFAFAGWLRPVGVVVPLRVLLLSIPVNVLWAPSQAWLERRFAYRRMGVLELGGDLVLYLVAVPLAYSDAGAWSLVAGFSAWQAYLLVASMALSEVRPRLAWSRTTSRALLAHGSTYSLTTWIFGLRSSIVTLVVGAAAGATGVGYVNFAQRLVMTLNFTDRGVHRIGMVAISRAGAQRRRLGPALEEATFLLTLVAAVPFVAFGLAARWVIPAVFGAAWLPALPVYVLLSVWVVLRVPSTVQRTLLYAYGKNYPPAVTSSIELAVAIAVSIATIHAIGITGYGLATVVGIASTAYSNRAAQRLVAMRFRRVVVPMAGLVPAVLVPLVPMPWGLLLLGPASCLVAHPATRHDLEAMVGLVRSAASRRLGRSRATGLPVQLSPALATGGVAPAGTVARVPAPVPSPGPWGEVAMSLNGNSPADSGGVLGLPVLAGHWLDDDIGPGGEDRCDQEPASATLATEHAAAVAALADGAGSADPFRELLEPDPVTGLPAAGVLLARLGRLLGAARLGGWFLAVVAIHAAPAAGAPPERQLASLASALRGQLRFDDPVARVGPSTFVAAVPLAPGGASGAGVAAQLETAAAAVLAPAPDGRGGADVRVAHTIVPLPSGEDADVLVRRVIDAVRG